MCSFVLCWITVTAIGAIDPVYDGAAYSSRDDQARALFTRVEGDAMMLCIQLGMRPTQFQRFFGPSLLIRRFRRGPIEWWYPNLGVTICFPARAFETENRPVQRVFGGIE